jgi:TolA-binding protein
MRRQVFLFISSVILLSGCLQTRAQLRENDMEDSAPQRQTVAQQQQQQAPRAVVVRPAPNTVASRLEEYDEQMRDMNGRIEALENNSNQNSSSLSAEKQAQARDKQALEQRFTVYEDALKKLQTQVQALSDEVTHLKTAPPPPPPAPVASAAAGKEKPGRTAYEEGEELFNNKKWKEAIVSYQKYRDAYPRGRSYGDATYKIGVAFQELGLKDEAKSFFEEVTSKFPGSKEAKKAAVRLKSLK